MARPSKYSDARANAILAALRLLATCVVAARGAAIDPQTPDDDTTRLHALS